MHITPSKAPRLTPKTGPKVNKQTNKVYKVCCEDEGALPIGQGSAAMCMRPPPAHRCLDQGLSRQPHRAGKHATRLPRHPVNSCTPCWRLCQRPTPPPPHRPRSRPAHPAAAAPAPAPGHCLPAHTSAPAQRGQHKDVTHRLKHARQRAASAAFTAWHGTARQAKFSPLSLQTIGSAHANEYPRWETPRGVRGVLCESHNPCPARESCLHVLGCSSRTIANPATDPLARPAWDLHIHLGPFDVLIRTSNLQHAP